MGCSAGSSRPGSRTDGALPPAREEPAAPDRRPGAGALAVRHPVRPALVPPGRLRRGLPGQGRRAVRARDRGPARPRADRRRTWAVRWSPTAPLGGHRRPHVLGKMPDDERATVVRRVARAVDVRPRRRSEARLLCGEPGRAAARAGTARPTSRCRSPRTSRRRSRCGSSSRPRTTPAWSRSQAACAPTPAVRHQRRPPARLPQPDHRGRARRGREGRRRLGQRRLGGRPGRRREGLRPLAARHARLQEGRPSTRWAGCSARPARPRSTPGDTLVTSIDARVQARRREAARARRSRPPAPTIDPVTGSASTSPTPAPPS